LRIALEKISGATELGVHAPPVFLGKNNQNFPQPLPLCIALKLCASPDSGTLRRP